MSVVGGKGVTMATKRERLRRQGKNRKKRVQSRAEVFGH